MLIKIPVFVRENKVRLFIVVLSILAVSLISYTVYATSMPIVQKEEKTQPQIVNTESSTKSDSIYTSSEVSNRTDNNQETINTKNSNNSTPTNSETHDAAHTVVNTNTAPSIPVSNTSPASTPTPTPSYPPYVNIGPGYPVGAVRPGQPLPENLSPAVVVEGTSN